MNNAAVLDYLRRLDGRVRRIEQRLNLLDAATGRTP